MQGVSSPVKLTRFNSLNEKDTRVVAPTSIRETEGQVTSYPAPDRLMRQLEDVSSDRKWPWIGRGKGVLARNCSDSDLERYGLQLEKMSPVEVGATSGSFKVVWRKLSFEVNQKTYDQLIGKALKRMRHLSRFNFYNNNNATSEKISSHQDEAALSGKSSSKKLIFDNLNGYANSGEITAILGPSGAGKTSLLNAICGRVEQFRGTVQLIGEGKDRKRLSIIPQKDYLMENLTVRENLIYSSRILNTSRKFDHDGNIRRVVKMLNLTSCYHSRAGNISGGEYKRVSIAQELHRQPDILILDEPTSGLDSLNCKNLIRTLKQLINASLSGAIKPMAIIMTIHQPDVEVFQMFDHVYCMARKGRVIFDGHPSGALDVIRKHANLSKDQLPDTNESINPANLLIEIASEGLGQEPIESLASLQRKQFENELNGGNSPQVFPLNTQKETVVNGYFNRALTLDTEIDLEQDAPKIKVTSSAGSCDLKKRKDQDTCSISVIPVSHTGKQLDLPQLFSSEAASSIHSNMSSGSKEARLIRDKRLMAKNDHTGYFWYHTRLLTKRSFVSLIRDPMMTILSLFFHLMVPFVMFLVYRNHRVGQVKACPILVRELDVISTISNTTMNTMEEQQEQLTSSFECATMFFLTIYSMSMRSLGVAALTFPLSMHVLLKEVRNGWYSLPTYVIGKTAASFPFEIILPVISVLMIYILLGMPDSYLHWRLVGIGFVMALLSMISHLTGLMFGALCMDSVQTAIFLAMFSTLPQVMLSGFTARINQLPVALQKLTWLSPYRYSSDSINLIRFGFGICPCDKSTEEYLRERSPIIENIPQQVKQLFLYYLTSVLPTGDQTTTTPSTSIEANTESIIGMTNSTTTELSSIPGLTESFALNSTQREQLIEMLEKQDVDYFGRLALMISRSFSYGRDIKSCDDVRVQLLTLIGTPPDDFLPVLLSGMFALLIGVLIVLFITVKFKIGSRV